ncbi:uncharacterized protein LOC141661248 [Apium graveolens]|uniref:uncharacterized protein LOC141661248 n=1 Tax=Apium graveolens TaxID=4045 RepID=UPI003D7A63FA
MEPGKNKDSAVSLNYPMLMRGNYTAWALKMKVYMQAHGFWDAVVPKDPKTPIDDKMDKIAMAAIYQSIPEDILHSLAEKETTKEVWEAIKVMCQGAEHVKNAKIKTLKAEFESLSMKDLDSLDDFCLKITGMGDNTWSQLLLIEEEWVKKEKEEIKLLLTRDEWIRRSNRVRTEQRFRGREYNRGTRDRSHVRCFNCNILGHFAADCRKSRRDKESKEEANIVEIPDEPALLLTECEGKGENMMLLNKEKVTLKLVQDGEGKRIESNLWYLDNGANNHMTGERKKFRDLDERITGQVKFGDGSLVHIKG